PIWRSVRNQQIGVVRNQTPVMRKLPAVARMVERPVEEPRLMRRTPELHSIDLGPAIFEIDYVLEAFVRVPVALKDPIVIAGDQQHMLEAQSPAEVIQFTN